MADLVSWRVELPYAVFSIDTDGDTVVDAAPIARWMIGKPRSVVRAWVAKKGGKIDALRASPEVSIAESAASALGEHWPYTSGAR